MQCLLRMTDTVWPRLGSRGSDPVEVEPPIALGDLICNDGMAQNFLKILSHEILCSPVYRNFEISGISPRVHVDMPT